MILDQSFGFNKLELLDSAYAQLKEEPETNPIPLLEKLPFDKRIIPISLDIRLSDDLIFRDQFNWDIEESPTP